MAHRFYDCQRWKDLRDRVLSDKPLCTSCEVRGLTEIATQVDHIIPISEGGNPTAMSNLQPLCASCHSRKTRIENEPAKTIETKLGYADTIVSETVVTKKGKGGRFTKLDNDETPQ